MEEETSLAFDPIVPGVTHIIAPTYDDAAHKAHAIAQQLGTQLHWRYVDPNGEHYAAMMAAIQSIGAVTVIVEREG